MTIRETLKSRPNIETDLLLAHVLKKPKQFVFLHPEYKLTSNQTKKLSALIKRRQKGEPVAYILGYKYFYGLKFKVNKNVLIPRPETEWLVQRASEIVKSRKLKVKSILDLGTGSGNIIISLSKTLDTVRPSLYASDVSQKALGVAKFNAKKNKTKINFIHSNLFNKINQKFDLIIANLPYVPMSDLRLLSKDLRFEPRQALTDDSDDFIIFQHFFEQITKHLKPKAVALLEIDPSAKSALTKYINKYLPKARSKFYKDLNKLWRYLEINT